MNMGRGRVLLSYAGLVFLIFGLVTALYYSLGSQYSTGSHILDTLRLVYLGTVFRALWH